MNRPVMPFLVAILAIFSISAMAQHEGHDHASPPAPAKEIENTASAMSSRSMSHDHAHGMGAHMHMSGLRTPQAGDAARAQNIVDTARQALEPYRDVKAAEADGYRLFLPNVMQNMYHFTNWRYAMEAEFRFNPQHP